MRVGGKALMPTCARRRPSVPSLYGLTLRRVYDRSWALQRCRHGGIGSGKLLCDLKGDHGGIIGAAIEADKAAGFPKYLAAYLVGG